MNARILYGLLAAGLAVTAPLIPALAQSGAQRTPEVCAAIEADSARLACYDEIHRAPRPEAPVAEAAAAPAPAVQVAVPSRWSVRPTQSQFDDSARVILSVLSERPVRGRFGAPAPATLMIRCEENTSSLFVHFNDLFMSDIQGYGRVDYRVDDRRPESVSMTASDNHQALGLWRGGRSIPFIRGLFGGERLYLRATPFNENRVEMVFPIAGLEEAIAPLRAACNW